MHEIGLPLYTPKIIDGKCGDIVDINDELYRIVGFYDAGVGVYVKKDTKIYKVFKQKNIDKN